MAEINAGGTAQRGVPFTLKTQNAEGKTETHVVAITKGRQQGTSNPSAVLQIGLDGQAVMTLKIQDGQLVAGPFEAEPEPTPEEAAAKKGGRPKKEAAEAEGEAAAAEA